MVEKCFRNFLPPPAPFYLKKTMLFLFVGQNSCSVIPNRILLNCGFPFLNSFSLSSHLKALSNKHNKEGKKSFEKMLAELSADFLREKKTFFTSCLTQKRCSKTVTISEALVKIGKKLEQKSFIKKMRKKVTRKWE